MRKKKLNKKENGLQSVLEGTLNPQASLSQEKTLSRNTYHSSCQTLSIGAFWQAVLDESSTPLIIEGNPKKIDLDEAFENIKQEYARAIKTPKSDAIFILWRQMEYLMLKKKTTWVCLQTLKKTFSQKICEYLSEMGYELLTEENYKNRLFAIENEMNSLDSLLEQAKQQYLSVVPVETEQGKRTMADYDTDLAKLSKYMGGGIMNKQKVTVSQYISMLNIFIEEQQRNKDAKGTKI